MPTQSSQTVRARNMKISRKSAISRSCCRSLSCATLSFWLRNHSLSDCAQVCFLRETYIADGAVNVCLWMSMPVHAHTHLCKCLSLSMPVHTHTHLCKCPSLSMPVHAHLLREWLQTIMLNLVRSWQLCEPFVMVLAVQALELSFYNDNKHVTDAAG